MSIVFLTFARIAAADTPQCAAARLAALGSYQRCAQKALAKGWTKAQSIGWPNQYPAYAGKCVTKLASVWEQWQTSGRGCQGSRFVVFGGEVLDNLTELLWEQKEDLDGVVVGANPHDADNVYTWSDAGGVNAVGTVFTDLLDTLNRSGVCFDGQCDWRLPTIDELLTILTPAFPACPPPTGGASSCIDPVFGPTKLFYWTATTHFNGSTWGLSFGDGAPTFVPRSNAEGARAVRGTFGALP